MGGGGGGDELVPHFQMLCQMLCSDVGASSSRTIFSPKWLRGSERPYSKHFPIGPGNTF